MWPPKWASCFKASTRETWLKTEKKRKTENAEKQRQEPAE